MKRNQYETEHVEIVRHLAAECTVLLKRDGKFHTALSHGKKTDGGKAWLIF